MYEKTFKIINYGRICWEEEGNAVYGQMMQPSQQHVAPCIKGYWAQDF